MTYQNNRHHREVLTTCRLLACCSCCLNFSTIIFLGWESIQNFSSHEQLCSNRIIQCEFQFSWEPIVFFKVCQDITHLKRQIQKIYAQNFISFLNAFFSPWLLNTSKFYLYNLSIQTSWKDVLIVPLFDLVNMEQKR